MFIACVEYDVDSMFDWCSLASMFIAFVEYVIDSAFD